MTQPLVVLRAAGTALVLDASGPGLPVVLHWGADLGSPEAGALDGLSLAGAPPVPHSALDAPWDLTLLPTEAEGWQGSPGVEVHRDGSGAPLRWRRTGSVAADIGAGEGSAAEGGAVEVTASDGERGVRVAVRLEMDRHGVLAHTVNVTNTGETVLDVDEVRALLPLPPRAAEILDLTGRWTRERAPQRSRLQQGTHRRASRRGRTGHDATLLMAAGTPGFAFRHGELWSVHVAWSGNHEHLVERLPEGAGRHASVLGGGELLRPGEVRLPPGETYEAPTVLFTWSGEGLDGVSARIHRRLRARAGHPSSPRPVVLNTWEAVYFHHDLDRLTRLADVAASVGVERFVLDDGWFTGRRDDRRGLGDWTVDPTVWPQGLHPLVDHVRSLGMQVGLWVEPEMVNVDSDLVRAHPEWVLGPQGHPLPWRHQQVLDLTNAAAWEHLLVRLDALVTEYRLDYLKWDHNRDLHEAVSKASGTPDRPAVRTQTLALYRLLDTLRERHPRLEIESCASGGARVDLAILQRTDRVWTSDSNDAVDRQWIQRWTELLVPPELMGAHVGPPVAHTTHRAVDLGMRLATALFGHAGIEWDVTTCTPGELDAVAAWISLYKRLRPLLHSGTVVRADPCRGGAGSDGEPADLVHGVVSDDGREAVFAYVRLSSGMDGVPGTRQLPGLDPARRYRMHVPPELPPPAVVQVAQPGWYAAASTDGLVVSGAVLVAHGLAMPVLAPAQALVLHFAAVPS
jgi:alpha-galactosidase